MICTCGKKIVLFRRNEILAHLTLQGKLCSVRFLHELEYFEDGSPISLYDQYANEVHETEF